MNAIVIIYDFSTDERSLFRGTFCTSASKACAVDFSQNEL